MTTNATTVAATTSNESTSETAQLFDLRQRPSDGKWCVWVQRSSVDLGLVSREYFEEVGKPEYLNPLVWVIKDVYDTKPTTDAVLARLGIIRRTKLPVKRDNRANRGSYTQKTPINGVVEV